MGAIKVHEFMSLDGVIDAPTWTADYGFDPKMGEAIAAAVYGGCEGILLGRTTYEMFEPTWSQRTVEDDPGAPFFNDTTKYIVSGHAHDRVVAELDRRRRLRPRRDPPPQGRGRRRSLRQRQRHARPRDARGRARRRTAPLRLPAHPRRPARASSPTAPPARADARGERLLPERRRLPRVPAGRVGRTPPGLASPTREQKPRLIPQGGRTRRSPRSTVRPIIPSRASHAASVRPLSDLASAPCEGRAQRSREPGSLDALASVTRLPWAAVPYYICPKCKERSLDIDGARGFSRRRRRAVTAVSASCSSCSTTTTPLPTPACSSPTRSGASSRSAAASSS